MSEAAGASTVTSVRAKASQQPLLTAAEEVRLAKLIERGDLAAKNEMIERNLRLVLALARPYRGRGVPYEDLVQEGVVGLVRAVEKFDHRRGLKFSTYAVWWIRRSLLNALSASHTIRIPGAAAQQIALICRAEAELRRAGQPLSDTTVAERADLSVRTVRALRAAALVTNSLDESVGETAAPLADLIADPAAIDAVDEVTRRETRQQVWRMLRVLPKKHREVLARRYGLLGDSPESPEEIGAGLGVGEERIRQIEREALHWLRELRGGCHCAALAG